MFNTLLIAACAPGILILLWVQRRDRLPEPPKVVWLTLLLGGLMSIPIIIVELGLSLVLGLTGEVNSYGEAAITAFVIAALVEEVGKFLVLWFYCARHSEFDEPMDGIVYGVAASMGFAIVENVMYVFVYSQQSMGVAIVRAITAVPMHAFCGVIMGTCIGIAKFQAGQRAVWIALGIGSAIAVHGLYDFGLFGWVYGASIEHAPGIALGMLGAISTLLLSGVISILAIARFRRDQERALLDPIFEPSDPRIQNSAPVLPMAAILTAAAASVCFVVVFVAAVAMVIQQEAGEDASALENLTGLAFFATLALAIVGTVVSIIAIARQPRWRAASISALVISALLLFLSFGLIVVGVLGQVE